MNSKEAFLLDAIMKAYITYLEPVGSSWLKKEFNISYSPATIRGYFKKLGDSGYLRQAHISSGRIPTQEAFKLYWSKLPIKIISDSLDNLSLSNEFGITIFIKELSSDNLLDIVNINDLIILKFNSFSVSINYNRALYRFLKEFIGISLDDILKISKDVGAYEVYDSIKKNYDNFKYINIKPFFEVANNFDENMIDLFLKGDILDKLDFGIYYESLLPSGYIGICNHLVVNDIDYKMLVVGKIYKNYEEFYKKLGVKYGK